MLVVQDNVIKTNKRGTNLAIKGCIVAEDTMYKFGFVDKYYKGTKHEKDAPYWYMTRFVKFPKESTYRDIEICIHINIPKNEDPEQFHIDVIDEDFCQPYDYQYILSKNKEHKVASIVKQQVEELLEQLSSVGIIRGWKHDMYV